MSRRAWALAAAMLVLASSARAKTVRYELSVAQGEADMSGRKTVDFALLVNGGIPAPTLEFTEGDDAEIAVTNRLAEDEVSIHWHGILLPPEMDGVPYVNTPPILPGETFTFRFRIRQSGTYWYHSHTNVQEQKGVYGAFVIHPREKTLEYDKDAVVVLSDWSDEDAVSILKNLRKDGDYYLHKKRTMRSWLGALRAGGLGVQFANEWTRMGGMDYSDVGYDAFLMNGKKRDARLAIAHPGETLRLRIINAAASTYFRLTMAGGPMRVVSADGVDVAPVRADEVLIGMAETYDLLFTVPEHKDYELRAAAQDGTGSASGWVGMGEREPAPRVLAPGLYAPMSHGGHAGRASAPPAAGDDPPQERHGHHGHHGSHLPAPAPQGPVLPALTVDELRAPAPTAFPAGHPRYDVALVLNGDMSRYVWHINGKTIRQERTLEIREGDVVRYTFVNKTMMHHPMHLHGHFFRVLNDGGESSPMKHTVDVPPHSSRTIEFRADEPGEWMLHCHNLYHLKTGMARVIRYSSYRPSRETLHMQKHDPHLHDHLYLYGKVDAASNFAESRLRVSRSWDELDARLEASRHDSLWEGEGDVLYRRWLGRYLNLGAGWSSFDDEHSAVATAGYLLPLLVEAEAFVSHRGKLRLDLEKRLQWTRRVFSDLELNIRQDRRTEFKATLMYQPSWSWAFGATYTLDGPGGGLRYQF